MSAQLLSCPTEILTKIFVHLDVKDAYAIQRVNRQLNEIYKESIELQYYLELKVAGMDNNPMCTLPIPDRLDILREREANRNNHHWNSHHYRYTVYRDPWAHHGQPIHKTSDEFVFFPALGTREGYTDSVKSRSINTQSGDGADQWRLFKADGSLANFACCIEENDLLVIITSEKTTLELNIHLHLIKHSTGKPHPLAPEGGIHTICHTICILRSRVEAKIEVVGDNLIMILKEWETLLFVYNWKTGISKTDPIPLDDLTSLVILRHDLFACPNIHQETLDVYHISPQPSVECICKLGLPQLRTGSLRHTTVDFYASPNPTGDGLFPKYVPTTQPYRECPEDALVVILLCTRRYKMVIHRKSIINKLPLESTWLTTPCPKINWNTWGKDACGRFRKFLAISHGQRIVEWDMDDLKPYCMSFNPYHIKQYIQDKKNNTLWNPGLES